jgi:hypothetical protein
MARIAAPAMGIPLGLLEPHRKPGQPLKNQNLPAPELRLSRFRPRSSCTLHFLSIPSRRLLVRMPSLGNDSGPSALALDPD